MLSSSARRAAFKTTMTSIIPSIPKAGLRITTSKSLRSFTHQRRLSSSKPSGPANGSKRLVEGDGIPATPARTKSDGEKKASSRSGKDTDKNTPKERRSMKDRASLAPVSDALIGNHSVAQNRIPAKARDEALRDLPRVQSSGSSLTEIKTSSFFAGHRPMTPGDGVPTSVSDSQFESAFHAPPEPSKIAQIIADIAKTMQRINLERNANAMVAGPARLSPAQIQGFRNLLTDELLQHQRPVQHLDGNPTAQNPPSPFPHFQDLPKVREYKARVTMKQYVNANGSIVTEYYSSPIFEQSPPQIQPSRSPYSPSPHRRTMLRRRASSEMRFVEQGWEGFGIFTQKGMYEVLSTKRLRKAKIKKKKYRKLLKRTRTLRRKLERNG